MQNKSTIIAKADGIFEESKAEARNFNVNSMNVMNSDEDLDKI